MALSISRWRPKHLLAAWGAYWAGLAAVALGRPALAAMRAAEGFPEGSTVSAGFGDTGLYFSITRAGATVWMASASLLAITLWVTVPPLLLWLVWLATRPRTTAAAPAELRAPDALGEARPQMSQKTRS